MSNPPGVRASLTQTFLRFVNDLPEDVRTRLHAEFPEAHRTQIQKPLGLGWVPLERHMDLIEAARRTLPGGKSAFRTFHRDAILVSFQQPFFKTIVEGFVRAFGLSPRSIMKAAPAGYSYAFRGCGELTYVAPSREKENEERLALDGFPLEHFASGTFSEAMLATLEAFLVVCKVTGEAKVTGIDEKRGRAEFVLTWHPKA